MNLMFWKKKTGTGEDAENARESLAVNTKPQEPLDFATAKQDVAERNPESHDPELPDHEAKTPAKLGLAARLKLRLSALTGHFRKAPVFHALEDHIPNASGGLEKPADAATIEPDLETPTSPGLGVRIKLRLIALTRRFRKTPALTTEEDEGQADESPDPEAPAKPGLFMRVKAGFAAFIRKIKAPAAPATGEEDEAGAPDRSKALPEEGELSVSETAAKPAPPRKWLVVGGLIFIVVLLLIDIATNFWLAYKPPQKRWGTRHDTTSISSRPSGSESTPEEPRNEVEALQKKNAELQARIEALKSEQPQQRPYAPLAGQTGGRSTPSSSVSDEMMVGSKDPKATAMSLKEAIETMNAGADDDNKKPAK